MIAPGGAGRRSRPGDSARWADRALAAVGLILATALGLLLPAAAGAHSQPYSFIDVRIDGGALHGRVTAHVVDLAHEALLPVPDSLLDAAFTRRNLAALEQVIDSHLQLEADGKPVRPRFGAFAVVPAKRSIGFEWTSDVREPVTLALKGPLFPYDPPHESYVNIYADGKLIHEDLLDHEHTAGAWGTGVRQTLGHVIRTFVLAGIHHIFIGPDHILFVVGLLLLGGSLMRLLKIVTAFTLAHTITLILATLRIVNPSPRIVEPAIALSIVTIGIETLIALHRRRDARARIAFGFGLVHGFGFASVLRDFGLPAGAMGWALGSFNLGVEVAQACIVLAVAPVFAWVRRKRPVIGDRLVTVTALIIIAAGACWFVQRLTAR